jgi:outer membrane protein assembly factor BamB
MFATISRFRSQAAVTLLLAATALTACTQKEVILPGERLDVRAPLSEGSVPVEGYEPGTPANRTAAVALPAARSADWSHRAGTPDHLPGNAALPASLTPVWSANIGQGNDRKHRIAADPVVAGGAIYTLDAQSRVTATATNGGTIWTADLTRAVDRAADASGGGIAVAGGRVHVTDGSAELVALDARTGNVAWRQQLGTSTGGGPTVAGGKVFVASRDGTGWGIDAATGKVDWTVPGLGRAGIVGASSPASDGQVVVFPFAGGMLVAAEAATGKMLWKASVAGKRVGESYTAINAVTGDPVIAGNAVYAGTSAGRIAAIDKTTGQVIWAVGQGAASPPAVAGGAVFIVTDQGKLMRLDAASGGTVWAVDLPWFKPYRKERKRGPIFASFGPTLAGGRLVVASGDGMVRSYDPASGTLVAETPLKGGAAAAPAVSGGVLYAVTKNGQLTALR